MTQSPHLWPRPANFKARSSDIGRLYYIITNGREGTFMAPQEDKLPQLARWRAAQYVQSLYDINSKATIRHPQGDIPVVSNPFSRADADAADQGRTRYDLWCAPCHAAGGRGSYLAPRLIDRRWKYGDGTDTAVWTIVQEGVPGKLMVAFEKVNPEERWKIITFLRYMGGQPDPLATAGKPSRRPQQPASAPKEGK
jgi:mono/diheme cytochrome c family protein